MRSKTFALTAVMLMMVSAFGAVLLTCTDGAEAAAAPNPPYAFSQTLTVDIRSSLPKHTTYYMVAGDTFNVHRGAWDVWYGGWFNTKYEKYVDITSVKWEQLGYNVGVTWDAGGISGLAPYGHDLDRLRVDWVLRYSDHGSGHHTVEDSGYFYIKVQGPVGVRLDCGDGVYKELLGRNSVVLPHEPKDGMTHVGWRQGTKTYQPGETYTTRMTLPILHDLTAVYDPIPPTPYSVTLISDPLPTSIETSAGTVTLTNGVGTILGGTVMHQPDLQRERHILHRWTDAAGNTYDWSKPVTSDLILTADWREHFSVSVQGNKVTVTLSPDLPTEYTTHQINWGDNTVNSELTHLYAATGDYTITVRSGQWGTWASSSTTINIDEVTTVTYTVTFDSAGGSAVPSQTVQSGQMAIEPAAPTRPGYNFTGWYLDGKLYDFNTPVTGDLYLSAGWKAVAVDDDKDDDEPANNLLLILLTVLTIISLAITLFTRSPYAFGLTVILALIELALLTGALAGVIA